MIAKSSGSSDAHFIVHTSRRWNACEASEIADSLTVFSEISISDKTPVESITANRLKNILGYK